MLSIIKIRVNLMTADSPLGIAGSIISAGYHGYPLHLAHTNCNGRNSGLSGVSVDLTADVSISAPSA